MTDCRPGSVWDLERILDAERPSTVALFSGGHSFEQSGAAAAIEPMLARFAVKRISGVPPNPTLDVVSDAVQSLRRWHPDLIVAVGGGSVIDVAKAARGLVGEPDTRAAVTAGSVRGASSPPLVAVPTTAGTGSEVTQFCVVYVDGKKHSVGHPSFRPEHIVLDPDLTSSMSPRLTAVTGLDALSQAMESLWSTESTHESLSYAQRALALAWGSLDEAVRLPSSASRVAMCTAAHLAGRAIDISRTTAAHALSYELTIRHGVAHGHAVALTLGAVLEHNAAVSEEDCLDERGVDFVKARIDEVLEVIGARDGEAGREALTSLLQRLGLETTLSALGVATRAERQVLVDSVDAVRMANNPRIITPTALSGIVDRIA